MEIFNIHIFEFLLIAGLALVVFGPERLPEVGRFIGKQVARFLAWQQQSPELKMLNDIRGEFESEIASLRDELTRTRKELNMQGEMDALREELKPMLDLRNDINPAAGAGATADATTPTIAPPQPASATDALAQVAPEIRPAGQAVPAATRPNRIVAVEPTNVLQPPAPPESEALAMATPDAPTDLTDSASGASVATPDAPTDLTESASGASVTPPDAPTDLTESASGASDPDTADLITSEVSAAGPETTNGHSAEPVPAPEADALLLERLDTLSSELQALVTSLRNRGVLDDDWRPAVAMHDEEPVS